MVHLPFQQTGIQAGVQGVEHGIQSGHRVMRFNHFGRVGQHHTDRAAAFDASGLQGSSQSGAAVAQLRPAVAALPMDDSF